MKERVFYATEKVVLFDLSYKLIFLLCAQRLNEQLEKWNILVMEEKSFESLHRRNGISITIVVVLIQGLVKHFSRQFFHWSAQYFAFNNISLRAKFMETDDRNVLRTAHLRILDYTFFN